MNAKPPELAAGAMLRGKYRVTRLLGEGGMGRVYEAVHVDLERRVAIKLLHEDLRQNAEVVERFVREGRAASKLDSDHVAAVLDVDRIEDGTPFLVMEFLEGRDLSYVRKSRSPLPVAVAVDYVLQACAALAQAHARGVIHRDIKPANLFLTRRPDGSERLKILDFGISKLADPIGGSQPSMTRTSLVMGSVEYMSPEQMLSMRDVDGRTDLWALAVVLYELLTANVPFSGETSTQVCAHVMSQPPIRPTHFRPDLPGAIEDFILRGLDKHRERRAIDAAEFAADLRAASAATPPSPEPSTLRANASAPEPSSTGPFRPGEGPRTEVILAPLTDSVSFEPPPGSLATRVSAAPFEDRVSNTTGAGLATSPFPGGRRASQTPALVAGGVALVGLLAAAIASWTTMASPRPRGAAAPSTTRLPDAAASAPEPAPNETQKPPPVLPPSVSASPKPSTTTASATPPTKATPPRALSSMTAPPRKPKKPSGID